jgi:hypothetical protein
MITQMETPCFVTSWDGDDRDDTKASRGGHCIPGDKPPAWAVTPTQLAFHTGDCGGVVAFGLDSWCTTCGAESLAHGDFVTHTAVRRDLDTACWIATSDGDSAELFEDADLETVLHFRSRGALEAELLDAGWIVFQDGRTYSPDDDPDDDGTPVVIPVHPDQVPLWDGN